MSDSDCVEDAGVVVRGLPRRGEAQPQGLLCKSCQRVLGAIEGRLCEERHLCCLFILLVCQFYDPFRVCVPLLARLLLLLQGTLHTGQQFIDLSQPAQFSGPSKEGGFEGWGKCVKDGPGREVGGVKQDGCEGAEVGGGLGDAELEVGKNSLCVVINNIRREAHPHPPASAHPSRAHPLACQTVDPPHRPADVWQHLARSHPQVLPTQKHPPRHSCPSCLAVHLHNIYHTQAQGKLMQQASPHSPTYLYWLQWKEQFDGFQLPCQSVESSTEGGCVLGGVCWVGWEVLLLAFEQQSHQEQLQSAQERHSKNIDMPNSLCPLQPCSIFHLQELQLIIELYNELIFRCHLKQQSEIFWQNIMDCLLGVIKRIC